MPFKPLTPGASPPDDFAHYKDLERGKWVEVEGWKDADAARREVLESIEAFGNQRRPA